MSLRPKTKRRLVVLVAGLAIVVGGGAMLVRIQLDRLDTRRRELPAKSMDQFNHGEYAAAMGGLKKYLNDSSGIGNTDPEAIYAYAVSRSRVPRPDLGNLIEAKANFNRYLELRPDDSAAQHHLLDIYQKLGYEIEATNLSDTLLSKDPDDISALIAKTGVLLRTSDFAQAITYSQKLNELRPTDLPLHMQTFGLMLKLKQPPEEVIRRAESLRIAHPNDPRFELLFAAAEADFAHNIPETMKWLKIAAAKPSPDAGFTRDLADTFDRMGMYDQAKAILDNAPADQKRSSLLAATIIQREWECEDFDHALADLDKLLPNYDSAETRLLALKALTLFSTDETHRSQHTGPATAPTERVQAERLVATLVNRSTDPLATSWAAMLQARFSNPPADPREAIRRYQAVPPVDPDNAISRYFTGLSYCEVGETELAMQAWRQAAALSPAWSAPHLSMAKAMLDDGRVDNAAVQCLEAQKRAPQSRKVRIAIATIQFTKLGPQSSADEAKSVLSEVQQIQNQQPNEPLTLPAYASLLIRLGHQQEAAEVIRSAIDSRSSVPPDTLFQLAQISESGHLGLENSISDRLGQPDSLSAQAALDRAKLLANLGKPADGLIFITAARDKAGANLAQWQLAVTSYREWIADPTVTEEWKKVADAFPDNRAVQLATLNAKSAWQDLSLVDRTIDRVKTLTGDDGIRWRLERARWQLLGPGNAKTNATSVVTAMASVVRAAPSLPEPLIIWSRALDQLGDTPGAIERLRAAAALSPADITIQQQIARLKEKSATTNPADALQPTH